MVKVIDLPRSRHLLGLVYIYQKRKLVDKAFWHYCLLWSYCGAPTSIIF
uniref:Uncharacterized protein n=1 Tax=Arundo donax TaxID=35708 RepID=A0A0A8YQG7_ARUDO